MGEVIYLSNLRKTPVSRYRKVGKVKFKEGDETIKLEGQGLKDKMEKQVKGGISYSLLKEIIKKRIADSRKRHLLGNVIFPEENKKAQGPTKSQIARLYKRIKKRGINPEYHIEAINKLIPKDQELTAEKMREIADDVGKMQNRIRYMSRLARIQEEERVGEKKIKNLTTNREGYKLGMGELGIENPHQSSVVSILGRGQARASANKQSGVVSSAASGVREVAGGFGVRQKGSIGGSAKNFNSGMKSGPNPLDFKKAA